jgi:hypothetical protein
MAVRGIAILLWDCRSAAACRRLWSLRRTSFSRATNSCQCALRRSHSVAFQRSIIDYHRRARGHDRGRYRCPLPVLCAAGARRSAMRGDGRGRAVLVRHRQGRQYAGMAALDPTDGEAETRLGRFESPRREGGRPTDGRPRHLPIRAAGTRCFASTAPTSRYISETISSGCIRTTAGRDRSL